MESIKVSVIVPVYNVEAYLEECVQSILHQTYTNLEIILVDDGSPDNCPEMCDQYAEAESRVRVIHKENGGLADARNAGMKIATGDYLEFVDSDDWIGLELIENQIALAKKYCASVVGTTMLFNGQKASYKTYVGSGIETMMKIFKSEAFAGTGWSGWEACGKLFDAKLLQGMKFPYKKLYEDLGFIPYVYFKNPKVVITDDAQYHYRIRSGSIMSETEKHISPDLVEMWDGLVQYSREHQMEANLVFAFAVGHLYKYFWKERRRQTDVHDPFLTSLCEFVKRNMWSLWSNQKIHMNAKIRFTELALFRTMIF